MTRLARLCEHDQIDPHFVIDGQAIIWLGEPGYPEPEHCPGGSLLPPDSLVIVKEDGELIVRPVPWPSWATPIVKFLDALAAAPGSTDAVR